MLMHESTPMPDTDLARDHERLRAFIAMHPKLFVLTGAGCSTDSGIPDYRDTNGGWKRPQPVTYQAFMGDLRTARATLTARLGSVSDHLCWP